MDSFSWVGKYQIRKLLARTTASYMLGKMLRASHALSHLILDKNPMLKVLLFLKMGSESYIGSFAQSYIVNKWEMPLYTTFQI